MDLFNVDLVVGVRTPFLILVCLLLCLLLFLLQAAQDFTVVINMIPVGGIVAFVFQLYGLPIDATPDAAAHDGNKAEEQKKDKCCHSYMCIRGLFAFCCLRCCSSLAGAACPRCSGSPICLVASSVLPSELTATCVREALSGFTS